MLSSEDHVEILRSEMRRLEQFLMGLPHEAWTYPSPCSEWCVADVVAHVARNHWNLSSRIQRALQGDTTPDQMGRPVQPGSVDPAGGAQRTIDYRKQLGEPIRILADYSASLEEVSNTLTIIGPGDWEKPVYRLEGPEPIREIIDTFFIEVAVHGWDIRSGVEARATLPHEALPALVERTTTRRRRWSFREGLAVSPIRFRFEVATPSPYRIDLVVTDQQQYMEVDSNQDSQVTFRTDGETYVMLMYGRVTPRDALGDGRVSSKGDQELVTAFADHFTGG